MSVTRYLLGLAIALWCGSALASTIYVGSCGPSSAVQQPTIGLAVMASGSPGTVFICPGTYPEQVTITGRNISLRGVTTSTSSAVILSVPPGGLVQNTTVGGFPTAAQIAIQNAANVTVSGLTIDGSNNNDTSCGLDIIGLLFQNASGTILNNSVSNQVQPAGYDGCQNGLAIDVENSDNNPRTVAIKNNYVSNFQKNGISADDAGLTATISGNTVVGRGPTTGAANNSILVAYGATGTVTLNYVADDVWAPDTFGDTGDAAAGILVYDSPGVAITKNSVQNTQYGIAVVGDGTSATANPTVTGNHVGATHLYDGIDICGSGNGTVSTNVVYGSDESGVHIDSTCGSPTTGTVVSSNTIHGGCAGVLVGSGSDAPAAGTNTIVNAVTQEVTGSDWCEAASDSPDAAVLGIARRHGHPRPAR